MTDYFTDDELESFYDYISMECLITGPQPVSVRKWRHAGWDRDKATLMWIKLVEQGRLIGDGMTDIGQVRYRPPAEGETLIVRRGGMLMTPPTAVAIQADHDQEQAYFRDLSPEEWERIEREVAEVEAEVEAERKREQGE